MAERLSLSEVSRLLKISPAELRTKCEAGEIAGAERAGGHWFFPSGIVKDVANEFGVPLLDDLPLAIEPPSADDFSKMEISTANLDGGIPDPFGDPGRKSSEPASGGADVLFGDLQESDDDRNDMRTVMGSAAELASRVEDEIRLETPKDETAEDTAVLSGELDADESNDPNDMRTMMGSAHQLGGDEQIGLHSEASGEFGSPFAGGPAKGNSFEGPDDDDAAVLGGELEPASGDMGTLMGSAGQFGLGRGPGEQIRLDAKSEDVTPSRGEHFTLGEDDAPAEDDADAAVLSGELETDADDASNDMRTMMGGAAQFGLGGGDPIDLNARQEEPSSAHEAFSLSEAEDEGTGDGGGMRTMVGDAASIGFDADQVRLDLSNREDLSGGSSIDKTPAQALEDSDDVALGGGMHTMVGDVSALGFDAARVQLEQEGGSSLAERASDDAAVLSGDLDVDDSNEMGTVMRSAADLAAEGSGEVRLAAGTSGGSSIDDDAAVLSGDLEVDDSGDMRTVMGGAGQFGFGSTAPIGLSGDDEEASAMDANFDEPAAGETGGMRTMVGDAASIGFNADQVRLDLSGRDELAGGSSITEAFIPTSDVTEDSDEAGQTTGGMHTVVGDASQFGFDADRVRLDLAGREEVPLVGGSSVSGDSSVNLSPSSIIHDDAAVLSGDLDADDSNDMRTLMGAAAEYENDAVERVNVSSAAGDDGSAVLSGDLDSDPDAGEMRTSLGGLNDLGSGEHIEIVPSAAHESDALVLSGNLDSSNSSSNNMRTEISDHFDPPGDGETVQVAADQQNDSSDRILIGTEDLNDSSDYSPASPTILGISPLESGSADQVLVDAMDVIDSDIRMNAGGGSRPEESDVRLVPDQASVDSDIRVSQLEDAAESGGIWPTIAKSASESRAFGSEDATPTLPEASQDLSETTPGIAPPNPVPEESDLSINMESPDAGDELPTITFAPPSASALPPPSLPQNLISMAPSGEDTAELDANSFELEADPAESDVTAAPFYMDDDVTLAEHTPDKSPAPSSSGFPTASSDEADEELTIAEGIDMKPSPDKTSLSLNPGLVPGSSISAGSPEPDAPAPAAGDSDLMLGGGDDLLQLSGSDVTTESPAAGANTSMVNLDRDADEDFVLGGEGGSDITINPSASGIGIGGGMESGLGLAGSGVDLEAPLEIGPSQSGLTLGVEDEFVLGSAGGSGVDQDDESDSGSQVIALDAASEDISNYTANPTMLEGDAGFGGMPLGGAPMLGGDPYAADPYGAGGLPDPMMNPAGQVGLAAPGYGAAPGYAAGTPGLAPQTIIVPRVELEYSPLQIVSLVFVTLVMVIAFLMMFDLTVLNGAQWTGIQWTASIVKPVVDLVGY